MRKFIFFREKLARFTKTTYFCTRNREDDGSSPMRRLGYGVMVTLQILVLPFLVRVRVAQQKKEVVPEDNLLCFY